jgi:AcrR family transcriptional regulator
MVLSESRANVNERRGRLLSVARDIFAERGYQATTMDDVAAAAGFTKPILYQHFASKESLYNEIVQVTSQQLADALRKSTERATSPREKVESAFHAFFEIVVNETSAFRLLFLQPPVGQPRSELRIVETRMTTFIEEQLTLSADVSVRRQIAAAIVGMAEGAATAWLFQQEARGWPEVEGEEVARLASRTASLAWGGLRLVGTD